MFETVEAAPPDPILGLTEAFNQDANPDKINLSVGVYKDADGKTPVLDSVKAAERRLLDEESSKAYMPIGGSPDYARVVLDLMFGADHEAVASGRAVTFHCPGGTGALRVAGNYLKVCHPGVTIWLSDPTWANHGNIFKGAGLEIKTYPYFDASTNSLSFGPMIEALNKIPAGDVVLLHGCCHNPTGVDPSAEQWQVISDAAAAQGFVPLIDFAYQGLAQSPEADATGLRTMCRPGSELMVCSSFSKNFGLYRERVGALTVITGSADTTAKINSQVKKSIRCNYSNPPAHGAGIVTTIYNDQTLRGQWMTELTGMRDRINGMRALFAQTLDSKGVTLPGGDNSFVTRQRGMFSFSGLNKQQVEQLRNENSIYIVGSGRINVAGMTEANMDRLCEAIKAVL